MIHDAFQKKNNCEGIYDCVQVISMKPSLRDIFNPSHPNPGWREKINLDFFFTLLCGAWKGFMRALKAFIKPSEATQRSVKIKI